MKFLCENAAIAMFCRLAAAAIFLYAGIAKLGDAAGFATTVSRYELFPSMANLVGLTFPWMEIVLGLCLLFGIWPRAAALGMLSMYVVFLPALLWALSKGLKVDCGCFGGDEPLSGWTVLRDTIFLLPALIAALSPSHRGTLVRD